MTAPHVPPLALDADFPPLELDEGLDAFEVDEVPRYAASGEGPHYYVRVRKTGLTTQQAVRRIASAAGVASRDIGVAGQKDRNAVTAQWMSVPDTAPEPGEWDVGDGIEIIEESRHRNKLRVGHVAANRFRLRFRCDAATAVDGVRTALATLAADGLPNYFGPQRFGRGLRNVDKALAWARGEFRLRGREARFKTKLFASVVQSEVFNRYLTARLARREPLLEGEVVRLAGSRSLFVVESLEAEEPRLVERDIVTTGPMVGPKCFSAAGEVAEMEDAARASLELEPDAWAVVARNAPGTRRDVRVFPEQVGAEVAAPELLVVEFTLPAGSYATQLARELTRAPWQSPLRLETDD